MPRGVRLDFNHATNGLKRRGPYAVKIGDFRFYGDFARFSKLENVARFIKDCGGFMKKVHLLSAIMLVSVGAYAVEFDIQGMKAGDVKAQPLSENIVAPEKGHIAGNDQSHEYEPADSRSSFTDNGNGTVTDKRTGLMWVKDANLPGKTMLFHQALAYIEKLNEKEYSNFGYTDWRLPTYNELRSLIDFKKYTRWGHVLPLGHPFENVQSLRFYDGSSPTYLTKPDHAWLVNCYCRIVGHNAKSCYGFAWPVRDER